MGRFDGHTSGLAPGYVQANLAILPRDWAMDFLRFCHANPRPCPLLSVSETGDPAVPALSADIDIRTDLPRYRVWVEGELVAEPTDLPSVWRDDLVSLVIGCQRPDVPRRHPDDPGRMLSRADGSVDASAHPADAIRAIQVTTRLPSVHGAPVHIGSPEAIGIGDLGTPDYGDAVPVGGCSSPRLRGRAATVAATRPSRSRHVEGVRPEAPRP